MNWKSWCPSFPKIGKRGKRWTKTKEERPRSQERDGDVNVSRVNVAVERLPIEKDEHYNAVNEER